MARFCTIISLSFLVGCIGVTSTQAQSKRVTDEYYLRFGQGVSDYAGDAGGAEDIADLYDTEKFTETEDFQYVLVTELGYQFTPGFSVGLGYQFGTYFLSGKSRDLQTLQILARYKLGARDWAVSPYVDFGANASTGTVKIGYGPSFGGGLDIRLNKQVSFFVESRFNLTFPDGAADPGKLGLPFDMMNALPDVGAQLTLRRDPNAVRVRRVRGPKEVRVGQEVTYSARVNEASATRPIEREWTFGDGGTGSGPTATHTFRQPGTYTVLFNAENEAGSDSRSITVTVNEAPNPARVRSLKAAPKPTSVGKEVLFRAEADGAAPLSYEWRFGDGETASAQFASHTYEEPGTYTVRLIASNQAGKDTRTLKLRVDSVEANPRLGPYTVQIGAFAKRENAKEKALRVLFDGFPARIQSITREGRILYRVWAGSFDTQQAAERALEQFQVYAPDAFVKETTPVDGPTGK